MNVRHRKGIRLKEYDYAQAGTYFVTICTKDRARLLWQADGTERRVGQGLCPCLSPQGAIAREEIDALPERFPTVCIEKSVIMPDHVHILLTFTGQGQSPCPTLGAVIGAYKSITTKRINTERGTPGQKIWQARFYDHIIRDEQDFLEKWRYIDTNPLRANIDENLPENRG